MVVKFGLVLEGGGFRGLYTAGILDYFLENNIEFPYVIGVSMGASNGTNYLSKQKGRNLQVPYTFINDSRYVSYKRLFTKGELFGMDFIFNDIPNELVPFDFKTFESSTQKLIYVTTDCDTGEPYYVDNLNLSDSFTALRASTSLPFAARMVHLHGRNLLDGGIADPIPVNKALADGCEKLLVILTQPKDYHKEPGHFKLAGKLKYKRYPMLQQALMNRHQIYNTCLSDIDVLQKTGKVLVIQPKANISISRTELNKEKLKEAYDLGYADAKASAKEIGKFLSE